MNPFDPEKMRNIFKISSKNPNRINSRESTTLEFKKSFSLGSIEEYARTCAAFANTKGGYIVFGVKNSPHDLIGLKDDRFEKVDPEKISERFNSYFDPYLDWKANIHEFNGKIFGILYCHESTRKPVLCKKSHSKRLNEGEIYYRYSGRTQVIRYSELVGILEERRAKEQKLWLDHLKKVSVVGIQNASVFDPTSGEVSGPGGSFYIDEAVLPSLNFIREGHFSESTGGPTLKLVGELESLTTGMIQPIKEITKTKGVRTCDVVHDFLDQTKVENPDEYIKQICFETAGTLPVYYYMYLAGMSSTAALGFVHSITSIANGKRSLASRLEDPRNYKVPAGGKSIGGYDRTLLRERLLTKTLSIESIEHLIAVLKIIRSLEQHEIDKDFLFGALKVYFDQFYATNSRVASEFRYTLCYLDQLFFENLTHPIS